MNICISNLNQTCTVMIQSINVILASQTCLVIICYFQEIAQYSVTLTHVVILLSSVDSTMHISYFICCYWLLSSVDSTTLSYFISCCYQLLSSVDSTTLSYATLSVVIGCYLQKIAQHSATLSYVVISCYLQ